MIDTHAHIYLDQFKHDLDETLERAVDAGVKRILMPNIDRTTIDDMLELELKHPDYCPAMMGLHPCSVDRKFEQQLYIVEEWLNTRAFVAVGEIGTDLYWDTSTFKYQEEAFRIQAALAVDKDLPMVIHCRESLDQTLDILESLSLSHAKGVFHCFTGTKEQAERIMALGFYLGIGGVVTFKNSGLDKTLAEINLDRVLLETDSPYLAPTPHRGKRNEPGYLDQIALKLAEIYDKDLSEISEITSGNVQALFQLES